MTQNSFSGDTRPKTKKRSRYILGTIAGMLCVAIVVVTARLLIKPAKTESPSVFCDMQEHIHNEACYDENGVLVCELQEHTHTAACYSNPSADVETESQIANSVSGVTLKGDLRRDTVKIAETQLGYSESLHNYAVDGDELNGYTRYGDWYGDRYADWNTLFISFCLHFAGNDSYPVQPDCDSWIAQLNEKGVYVTASACVPEIGNIVFTQDGGRTIAGIISDVTVDKSDVVTGFKAIFGDLDDKVRTKEYSMNSAAITGYFILPEQVKEEPAVETVAIEEEIPAIAPKAAGEGGSATGTEISRASDFSNLANGGQYYLSADITVTSTVSITKSTTLDLNGHKLTASGASLCRITTGGTLNIIDSAYPSETGEEMPNLKPYGNTATYSNKTLTYYSTSSAVVSELGKTVETVWKYTATIKGTVTGKTVLFNLSGGTLNLNEGALVGCTARAITMSSGTLNLNSGYICGNTYSSGNGGAITASGGTINLKGTVLAANSALNGGAIYLNNATLNMSGGTISGNKATKTGSSSGGGGVYLAGTAKLNMTGGYITNNSANEEEYSTGGGAVYMYGTSVFTMTGGYITGNTGGEGGAIHTCGGQSVEFIMSGGHLSANVAQVGEGGGITIGSSGTGHFYGGYVTNNITNTTQHWGGGGIFCADGGTVYVKDALVTENKAGGFGGGIAGCSTGRVICVNNGSAVYNNTAQGQHMSGTQSVKQEDHKYGANSTVFMSNGYQDFFSAYSSIVENQMLGGGSSNWYGSADGSPVNSSGGETLQGTYVMGLTSFSNEADQKAAVEKAKLFINGNESYTHGGGILCNGYLVVGETDKIDIFARIQVNSTKQLLDENGEKLSLAGRTYRFVIRDSNGIIVSEGVNDVTGSIIFDRRIPFKQAGTFDFFMTEETPDEEGITGDTTEYRLRVTVALDSSEKLPGTDIVKNVYKITNVVISKRNGTENWVRLSSKDYQMEENGTIDINPSSGSSATFTNYRMNITSVRVLKKWSDGSSPRPVTVQLYQNGKAYGEKVVLNDTNGWTYLWSNLILRDQNEKLYSYSVKEDPIPGYIGTYSVANTMSAGRYWVPATELTAGEQYMIVNAADSYALSVSDAHANTAFTSTDKAEVSLKSGTLSIGGKEYTSWFEDVIDSRCIFTAVNIETNNYSRLALQNCGTSTNCWLVVQSTTSNYLSGTGTMANASAFRFYNERLQGQIQASSSNTYRYASYSSSKFTTSSSTTNAVHLYRLVSTGLTQSTVITITNTKQEETKFTLQIRKSNQSGKMLPNATFRLYDESGNPVSFVKNESVYTYAETAVAGTTEELLVTNASGIISMAELPGGTYILRETDAPPGYVPVSDQTVVLGEGIPENVLELNLVDPAYVYVLPETGGTGKTVWPYAIGGLLMLTALAGAWVLMKQKSNHSFE